MSAWSIARSKIALALDQPVAAAELNVDLLTSTLEEVRRADAVSAFPSIARDLNFIVDEPLRWSELESAAEMLVASFSKRSSTEKPIAIQRKTVRTRNAFCSPLQFQSMDRTLNSEEVDRAVAAIIAKCGDSFAAKLLSA